MIDFKPSQILLHEGAPLTATMGKAEAEHAATLLVRACCVHGDAWQACSPKQVGEAFFADLENGIEPLLSLQNNPFFCPDFRLLVQLGFGRYTDESEQAPIEFTELGLEALRRYVMLNAQH